MVHQELPQGVQAVELQQAPGGEVGHDDDGNHDLVGREPQNKGHKDHSVQPQKPGKGVQEPGTVGEHTDAPHLHIGAQPNDKARRSGHCYSPPQYKEGPVQHRPGDDLPHPGPAVGRQLQGEGGGHAFQDGGGQEPGHPEGHDHAQEDDAGEHNGRFRKLKNQVSLSV